MNLRTACLIICLITSLRLISTRELTAYWTYLYKFRAVYGDYTTSKILDITANIINVTSEPSFSAKSTTIFPYNSFDVTFSLKSSGFITAADNIIVIKYDTNYNQHRILFTY